ncbi:tetratricopeptide repeat protein [Fulvivirga sediminis]|uniref:Tetratricopeptide repeat protein n=1 Tax=Fulvivirga sediminis TaxID=2803949 RepID=A0A937F8E5_9BACT|nr:tetratricopeptide repeat protein [Fulvivirga sediminis]MBL3658367.1 tetratricopeptide repeat protein [Fulvivirga sediminis]
MNQTAQEYINEGVMHSKKNDFATAIEKYSHALSIDPANAEALYNRAKCYVKLQQVEKALQDFDTLIDNHKEVAFYYSERAVVRHLNKQNDKAMEDLDRAVELEPDKPFRYSSRAFIKEKMGNLKGALEDYEKTISLDPEDAIAFNNKGLVEEQLGYMEQSKKSFHKADSLDPKKTSEKQTSIPEPRQEPASKVNIEQKQKTTSIEVIKGEEPKLTVKGYLHQVKKLISDKEERKQFKQFIKNTLTGKKD